MLRVRKYGPEHAAEWDDLVAGSTSGTFLHTQRFLSYHGDRFDDRSLCLRDDRDRLIGIFPAAVALDSSGIVVSHPGLTYGGMIHGGKLRGPLMLEALEAITAHYADAGFASLRYKAVPQIYHRSPAEDDLYALFRLGAVMTRCDLSVTVGLNATLPAAERRKRGLKKAWKAGLTIARGAEFLPPLWEVLEQNLERQHGVRPVHTLAEIQLLQTRFPDEIGAVVALFEERVVAGTVLFRCGPAHHAQYIASSPQGQAVSALDLIFDTCISAAGDAGVRFFDFGICTEKQGQHLNAGLYRFKSEFGGAGTVYTSFDLSLK